MPLTPLDVPRDLGFTADHDLLRKTVRRVVDQRCPPGEVRRLVDDPTGHDPALWRELVELGWPGLGVSEASGGAGLDHLSLAILFEETGRRLLPGPLLPTTLAALAADAGGDAALCAEILSGRTAATVGLAEPGAAWDASAVAASARPDGDGWVLDGDKHHVLGGAEAAVVIAPFQVATAAGGIDPGSPSELALFAVPVPGPGVEVTAEVGVDSTRRMARLSLRGAGVAGAARLGGGGAAWQALHTRARLLLAAEATGAASHILAVTRDYACERVQFERPIGSFQAVKHPLVDVLIAVEQARNLVYAAAALLDAGSPQARTATHMAKAAAGDALAFAADRGVQLHGGFGFTWDCDAHFYFKRGLWANATLGDPAWHRRQVATQLLG